MSRTDVHAPMWVKKLRLEWRGYFVEYHDHRFRSCNFDIKNENWSDCLLSVYSPGRNIYCGCKMCTGQEARRHSRRSERHQTKQLLRSERWDHVGAKRRARW